MDISRDEIYDYVFKLLSTSADFGSLTMRNIMDGLQEKFGLDSFEKGMKSKVRETVDKVYAQLQQKEGDKIDTKKTPLKSNTKKYPQTKSKRKRDGSSEESSKNSTENKKKKDSKKQKIEQSDDSDDLNSVNTSLEKSSSRKSNKKAGTHKMPLNKGSGKKDLNGKHKSKEDSSDDSDVSVEFESGNGENEMMLVVKKKQNKKIMKAKSSSEKKYAVDITDSSDNQMSEEKSTSSEKKLKMVEARGKNDVSSDSDDLMSLKNKLKKFEHSVENSDSNFTMDSEKNWKKKQKKATKKFKQSKMMKDDDSDFPSEDDFENVSVEKNDMMMQKNDSRSSLGNKSDDELLTLKSKLKNFEDSVDTKSENQRKSDVWSSSDDNGDDERSLKKPSAESSGESASGKKQSKSERVENASGNDRKNFGKKKKRGSYIPGKEDLTSSRKEKEDSSKLKNLKRYLRACGMHQNYIKFFEECRSMAGKERKLEEHIREVTGIEGRITLEKCKKYKLKKEEADELAELDVSKIIGTPEKGKRVTRQSSSCSVSKQAFTPSPAGKGVFSNLRDLLDSEESESEKGARKTKKTIVLDSDEDEEDKISLRNSSEDNESEDEGNVAETKHISENVSDDSDGSEENKMLKKSHSANSSDQSDAEDDEMRTQALDSSKESD